MEALDYPQKLFVDSSALIALAATADENHASAKEWLKNFPSGIRLITSHFILDEMVTRLRGLLGVEPAWQMGKYLMESGKYEMIWIGKTHCEMALKKMKKFSDHRFSFTDCTSFVVMEEKGIRDAFAFDDDFKRAGFRMHPE